MAPGIRFIVPGWVPSRSLPLLCVPAAPQLRPRSRGAGGGWNLLPRGCWNRLSERTAGNFGENSERASFLLLPTPLHRRLPGRDKEGQSDSHRVAAGRGRWWPPASGDSPGQLSRVPGTAPREGGFGDPSPLPKSRLRFAHAALPPRRGDWSTGSSHPFWKFYQPDFEVFLRCAAWGALQGPVKSGDPSVCTYIFIQSGSVLLQD